MRRRKRKPPMRRTRPFKGNEDFCGKRATEMERGDDRRSPLFHRRRKDGKGGDFVIVVDVVVVDVVVVVVIVVVVLAISYFVKQRVEIDERERK